MVLFRDFAFDHRMTVFGEISEQLRDLATKHAGGMSCVSFFRVLKRRQLSDPRVPPGPSAPGSRAVASEGKHFDARSDAMVDVVNDRQKVGPQATAAARRRRVALILILIVDVGYIAWGAGAAASPDHLLGPAIRYDWIVNAIGPFEADGGPLGLALVWGALAVTAPFRAAGRPVRAIG